MSNLILSTLSILALLIHPLSLSAQNSFSISLDVNSTAGDQAVTSVTVSADEAVTLQIFGKDIQNTNGLAVRFKYNATQVVYEGFEVGNVLPNAQALPEQGTNPTFVEISIASFGGQATVNSGLIGTIRFRTLTAFSGTEIRLVRADLGRGGQIESVTLNLRVALQLQRAVTPDFDGDGRVGFSDFLAFAGRFGSRQGDGRYEARYDLDSDGAIGFSDFLTFSSSFGKEVSPPTSGMATMVAIPDTNLRAVIEDSLGKASGAPITRGEMVTLTSLGLEAPYANISDLTGLEFATRLTSLHFGYGPEGSYFNRNSISDLSPLSGLTSLERLYLYNNSISDVSDLSGLTSLKTLYLYNNSISDVSGLSGLTSLERLSLYNNSISDVSGLSGLTSLETLYLGNNSISDVSDLSGLTSLERLSLYHNSISDVSDLSGLTSLETLYLYNNSISDVSGLSGLTSLETLYLGSNKISDVSDLSGLTSLEWLDLSNNSISDVSDLSGLTSLERLYLSNNSISDVSDLSGLTSLKTLYLYHNSISDVSGLSGLTSLERLYLSINSISDVSGLSGLTSLETLHLSNNSISDVSDLSGLTSLKTLSLYNNSISDVSGLSGLTSLKRLSLYNNSISDVSDLSGLTSLKTLYLGSNKISDLLPLIANMGLGSGDYVDVRDNPLSPVSINTVIPALQRRGVDVRFGASKPAVEDKELGTSPWVIEPVEGEGRKAGDYISRTDGGRRDVIRQILHPNDSIR